MEEAQTTLEHRMLTDTLGAFGDGNAVAISPEQGILLLEGWMNALRGDIGAERILAEVEALRDHLKSGEFDESTIRNLLLSLASHTSALSHEPRVDQATARQLSLLVTALRNFSHQF
ncbi:hypothetical protein WBJ53_06340 [Spirosoma sp. SC4-14]|uniref:hypothetical protein n=1 Tax=Spirosoma sp. SC4-14 TaxID=3128900 RepID=UPI0030D34A71